MKYIYKDLWAEFMVNELGGKKLFIYNDEVNPILILDNKLQMISLRDYLSKKIKEYDNIDTK